MERPGPNGQDHMSDKLPGMTGWDEFQRARDKLLEKNGQPRDGAERAAMYPEFPPDVVAANSDEALRRMRIDLDNRRHQDAVDEAMGMRTPIEIGQELEESA